MLIKGRATVNTIGQIGPLIAMSVSGSSPPPPSLEHLRMIMERDIMGLERLAKDDEMAGKVYALMVKLTTVNY